MLLYSFFCIWERRHSFLKSKIEMWIILELEKDKRRHRIIDTTHKDIYIYIYILQSLLYPNESHDNKHSIVFK